MSSSTLTNILTRLNVNFPEKGKDNDSQGFRDNYINIKKAFEEVDTNLTYLKDYTVKTDSTASYNGNTIEDVNFKNHSIELYSLDTQSGSIEIDYALGSYQQFEVTQGTHTLTISNWPGEGKSGKITLSITAISDLYTAINFPATYINLNPQLNPFELTSSKPNIFEIWSEDGSDTVFVRYLTAYTYDSSSATSVLWANQLKLGKINNNSETTVFSTSTKKSTVVQRSNEFGEIALVPNRVDKVLRFGTESTGPNSVIQLQFDTVSDLVPGAFFYTTLTNSVYTVTSIINTTTVAVAPNDIDVGNLVANVDTFKFTNPNFTAQPTLLTLAPTAANTNTGSRANFIGSVFANRNRLEVTYGNFGNTSTNTFVVQTLQTSSVTSYYNTDLVDTSFVHNVLPIGSVIMWYGKKTEIPYGWALCDGTTATVIINGALSTTKIKTPDLRNRFVIGAVEDYPLSATFQGPSTLVTNTSTISGGLTDSVLPAHSHNAVFTGTTLASHTHNVNETAHTHSDGAFVNLLKAPYAGSLTGNDTVNSGSEQAVGPGDGGPMLSVKTNVSIDAASAGTPAGTITVASTGTSSTGTNLPPYFALYYIMKVSGYISTSSGIVYSY